MKQTCFRKDENCKGSFCKAWDVEERDCLFVLAAKEKVVGAGFSVLHHEGGVRIPVVCDRCAELKAQRDSAIDTLQGWQDCSQYATGCRDPVKMGEVLSAWRGALASIADLVGSTNPNGPLVVEDVGRMKRELDKSWELLNCMVKMYMPYFPVDSTYADPDQGLGVVLGEFEKAKERITELEQTNAALITQRDEYNKLIMELRKQHDAKTSHDWERRYYLAHRHCVDWQTKRQRTEHAEEIQSWKDAFMRVSERAAPLREALIQVSRELPVLRQEMQEIQAQRRLTYNRCPDCDTLKGTGVPCPNCDECSA